MKKAVQKLNKQKRKKIPDVTTGTNFLLTGSVFFISALFITLFVFTRNQIQFSPSSPPPSPIPSRIPSPGISVAIISSPSPKTQEVVKVMRVIDGDTIEIEGGKKVRYIGIDAPELTDKRTLMKCFADKALAKNKELVERSMVHLVKDMSETDRYGRLLRYVYKEDMFINELLIREGYAYAASFPPDITYQEKLSKAQREAREKMRGLWGSKCM